MTERINMFEHPEYQTLSKQYKESPFFDFDMYLKNKGKTLEELDDEFNKNIANFDKWLTSVTIGESK